MPGRYAEIIGVGAPLTGEQLLESGAAAEIGSMLAQLAVIDGAVRSTSWNDPPRLGSDVDAAIADTADGPAVTSAREALDRIEELMTTLADRFDGMALDEWNRTAESAHGPLSMNELAQGAVRVAAERLLATERAIRGAARN